MPVQIIRNLEIPALSFDFSEEYWPRISEPIKNAYGVGEIKDAAIVQEALKLAFVKCDELFMGIIANEKHVSFYLYTQHLLENTFVFYRAMLGGENIPEINKSDLAGIRRTLRIILEQSTTVDLTGHPNFMAEIAQNREAYHDTLDRLLYLGYYALFISEEIARSQLFLRSINFEIDENGLLGIGTEGAYKPFFNYVDGDISKHDQSIALYHTIEDLIKVWRTVGVEYGNMTGFLAQQINNPRFRFALVSKDQLYHEISQEFGERADVALSFYDGLTVSRKNVLSFENCLLRSQDTNRIIYRPLVEVNVDNQLFIMAGYNRWLECLGTLTTNALPWGHVADEWKQHKPIKKFVQHLQDTHDDILENAAVELIKVAQLPFDKSVKSLRQHKGDNFPINNVQGVGEMDIVFADTQRKILYIVECKHNKSRFDYFNWKRDYTVFKEKYETQLNNKITFANAETARILVHLEVVNKVEIADKDDYTVQGIFLINAPTLYMYDAVYPTLTLHNLRQLLNGEYTSPRFELTLPDGQKLLVEQPYFTNLDRIL
ncbi:hypothetical protein DJ568_02855 [Mucilaginibacter hurinus]|uniref:NERD domain-containing protein n=1 Tax=Mucilaginibacter hurinus TaxID=2201324 RepID=A0A367GU28_9SPHI|nr:hypothetical protein [Mucilaginibacter hurinus]RCH56810.1 hypothetical protein DJ568_02855 [Mucilaginibacter hurinus]